MFRYRWPLSAFLAAVLAGNAFAAQDEPVAVFTQVFNGYRRTQLSDKSFKAESYVFGEGGYLKHAGDNPSLETMPFMSVARAVAAPLARLNYLPSHDPANTNLLILVFWGTTQGSADHDSSGAKERFGDALAAHSALGASTSTTPPPVMIGSPMSQGGYNPSGQVAAVQAELDSALWQISVQNRNRDQIDNHNARILGYEIALDRARFIQHMAVGKDILWEISRNRYFVVLQAYDFPTAAKKKKMKPLWTARISIDEAGNEFANVLDNMLAAATPYLGQDGGLRRHVVREGRVEVGSPKVMESAPQK